MADASKKTNYLKPMPLSVMVLWTGLFGGVFWSAIGYISYFFHLTEIRPNVILQLSAVGNWKYGLGGGLVSILLLGILSIGISFIYYGLLKKYNGIWVGMAFGLLLFLFVFWVLNPLIPGIKPLSDLGRNTVITSICLYVLYGLFIGYSIHYESENQKLLDKVEVT